MKILLYGIIMLLISKPCFSQFVDGSLDLDTINFEKVKEFRIYKGSFSRHLYSQNDSILLESDYILVDSALRKQLLVSIYASGSVTALASGSVLGVLVFSDSSIRKIKISDWGFQDMTDFQYYYFRDEHRRKVWQNYYRSVSL